MDNKIVSTTYVPLQPPYQIIKYTGDIAMQIGTLIVTIQKEGNVNDLGYEIETHSHPVVSYENKDSLVDQFGHRLEKHMEGHQFLEGAVWNYVEVKDVTTICFSDTKLPWREFIDFLNRDVDKRMMTEALPSVAMYWSLKRLGVRIERPIDSGPHIVHFDTRQPKHPDDPPVVRSRAGDIFCLNARADNKDIMWEQLTRRLETYMMIFRDGTKNSESPYLIKYETEEERYRPLVDKLNNSPQFTSMIHFYG